MLQLSLIETLLHLSDTLPTGRKDSQALEKYHREMVELAKAETELDQRKEGADCIYYLAKAWDNGLINQDEFINLAQVVIAITNMSLDKLLLIAITKYGLRSRRGNPKSHAEESVAVGELLKLIN